MDVPLRRDGGDLCNLGCGVYGFGVGREEGEDAVDGGLGAAGEVHGVAACCYVLDAFGVDGAGKDGGCYRSAILLVFCTTSWTRLHWGVSICFSSIVPMIRTEHRGSQTKHTLYKRQAYTLT